MTWCRIPDGFWDLVWCENTAEPWDTAWGDNAVGSWVAGRIRDAVHHPTHAIWTCSAYQCMLTPDSFFFLAGPAEER